MSHTINEIGNIYGQLTVIKPAKSINGRAAWECQCTCGNIIIVTGKSLRQGYTTSCGCSRGINEVGNRYGKLTVLKRDISQPKNHGIFWICQCECGNITTVRGDILRTGRTTSCGCRLKKNLLGQHFGQLTVIGNTQHTKNGQQLWECQCSCGNIRNVPTNYLTSGIVTHCGCQVIKSKGEQSIEQFLINNKIEYIKQFQFPDCKNKRPLSFDFAILKNEILICLIEFQGEQHFKPMQYFGGEEKFIQQQINDSIKYDYCQLHNIPLYYIKYNEQIDDKLTEILYL